MTDIGRLIEVILWLIAALLFEAAISYALYHIARQWWYEREWKREDRLRWDRIEKASVSMTTRPADCINMAYGVPIGGFDSVPITEPAPGSKP